MSMKRRPHSAESGYSSADDDQMFLETVKGLGRLNLDDDGVRNWEDEAIERLNTYYHDWKNPESSYMVPASFRFNNSEHDGQVAEKHIFDLLENFGQEYKEPMFVVHSYNFQERCDSIRSGGSTAKGWVIGEHDFVIIHKLYGVIFFQVKAKNKKNNWMQTFTEAQTQIKKDKVSLKMFIEQRFKRTPKKHRNDLGFYENPGFVVMPNFERPVETSLSVSDGVFKEDCCSVESFRNWWLKNVAIESRAIASDVYETLIIRFVALVTYKPPVSTAIEHSFKQISMYYTPQQLKIFMGSAPKQWITGPAGSGKTVLIIDKVTELINKINKDKKMYRILVLVFNKPLRDYLCQKLKKKGCAKLDVMTFMQFLSRKKIVLEDSFFESNDYCHKKKCEEIESSYIKLKSSPPEIEEKYEHIFVDEGQDLFNEHWPELLKLYHNEPDGDPFEQFYFWVMFDSNQHVQPGEAKPPYAYLNNASRLTHVLRNTGNIFDLSKIYFASIYNKQDIELGHKEAGLNILYPNELEKNWSNYHIVLYEQIMALKNQGVQNEDIVILTETVKEGNIIRSKLERYQDHFQCQNAEQYQSRSDKVIVESIRRFKGLEKKVVILLEPSQYGGKEYSELMYVAVSRCMCYLIIIKNKSGWRGHSGLPSENQPELKTRFDYDNQGDMHNVENVFGKNENIYESGPPEIQPTNYKDEIGGLEPEQVKLSTLEKKQYVATEKRRKRITASQKESRPLHVNGKKLLEPGDEYIRDDTREKVFNLLREPVINNLKTGTPNKNLEKSLVETLVAKIEYVVYKKHRYEGRSQKYTKELRDLKAQIQSNNKAKQRNHVVWDAYQSLN